MRQRREQLRNRLYLISKYLTAKFGGEVKKRATVFSQPTRGFGQRAPCSVSADFTLNFNPLYLNQYGSN
ncbi:hypothetical protein CC80DRAFT_544391 [Byssothecium circinans]|uniref:Uncharacterized protein n=1 Tax=Byssothecium circinans TaxID=147558 RepID=A0A6A5U8I8_9PLEO|nr:hypothetical protein CC80DRAFT_544391 [Byssothecium circinans]